MPGMNGTGPQGMGPRTGGGRGLCGGTPASGGFFGRCGGGYARHGRGVGMGLGYQNVSGWGGNREDFLKSEAVHLKNRLDFIQKELDNIPVTQETDDKES